jgi:uncharacterized paraquat-inducible protein A
MQCPRCHAVVEGGSTYCPYCGLTVRASSKSVGTWPIVALASAGLVWGFPFYGLILSLPALILSIIGLVKSGGKEVNKQGYWMAFWAVVANSVALVIFLAGLGFVVAFWPEIVKFSETMD